MTPLLRAVSLAALLICSAASSAIALDQPSARADAPAPLTSEQRDRLIAAVQPYRTGNWKGSVAGFTLAAQSPTPIAEYVLYLLGDSLSRLNDPEAAAAAALQAADRAAEGPLAPAALLLAGE
jgi:hypothetical protein